MRRYAPRRKQIAAIHAGRVSQEKAMLELLDSIADDLTYLQTYVSSLVQSGYLLDDLFQDGAFNGCYDSSFGVSLAEIGRQLGTTTERVRQIEKNALRKLRHPHISKLFRGFL